MFDLYNNAYGNYAADPYRQVRIETYGQDFGQTSWVTTEESLEIPRLLEVGPSSSVLEIGCGSGGYALYLAEKAGCQIVGVDINEPGIRSAKELAQTRGLDSRARFERCDVSKKLPFDDETFDAVFSNDVLCHVPGRLDLLVEDIPRVEAIGPDVVQRRAFDWRDDFSSRKSRFAARSVFTSTVQLARMSGYWNKRDFHR